MTTVKHSPASGIALGWALGAMFSAASLAAAAPAAPNEVIANAVVADIEPPKAQVHHSAIWPVTVAASFAIDRVGRPHSIQVGPLESPTELQNAARAAIEQWKFWPALGACRHVEQAATVNVVFDEKSVGTQGFELAPITARRTLKVTDFAWLDPADPGDTRPRLRTARAGFIETVPLKIVPPKFPAKASRQALYGYAFVMLEVGTDGKVLQANATDAWSPDPKLAPQFGAEAVRAVKQWRFQPASQDGKSIRRWACHRILFNMKLGR